jgi:hypothetical protein
MRFKIIYQQTATETGGRRVIMVEAADEGAAYDKAMEAMGEDEALIGVEPVG